MGNLTEHTVLSTFNEKKQSYSQNSTYEKEYSNNQKIASINYPVNMQLPVIGSTALFLMGCGGGGSSSGSEVVNLPTNPIVRPELPVDTTIKPDLPADTTVKPDLPTNSTAKPELPVEPQPPTDDITDTKPMNDINAARFLQQAQFSSTKAEIEYVKRIGESKWLRNQFNTPIEITGYDWLSKQGVNTREFKYRSPPADWMAWQQLMSSKDTLRKRMALALSEIMVMSGAGMTIPCRSFAIAAYWDILNEHAFGNFRDLLKAVTINAAMGDFLSLKDSKKADDNGRRPDENYAREIMQLFTIGLVELNLDGTPKLRGGKPIETYDQETVSGVAQALTGWNYDKSYNTSTHTDPRFVRAPMVNIPKYHDSRRVSFFGTTVPEGASGEQALDVVIDTLSSHPNVAPFISKQLIQRFVASNPSPDYVRRVATIFNNSNGNLETVIQAVLLDDEARRIPDKGSPIIGKVREPIIRLVQWVHTFSNRQSISGEWVIKGTSSRQWGLNQSTLQAPSVFNFFNMDYAPNTDAFIKSGIVAPELQLHNETSTVGYVWYIKRAVEKGLCYLDDKERTEIAPDYSKEMPLHDQPEKLIADLNLILCAGQMSDKTISLITKAMEGIHEKLPDWKKNRIHAAVLMTMVSPDYLVQK